VVVVVVVVVVVAGVDESYPAFRWIV